MSTNAKAVNARLKKYREIGLQVDAARDRLALRALEIAVHESPVGPHSDDGQFRGAWRLSTSREMDAPDTADKNGAATVARGKADLAAIPAGAPVHLVNAMPYAGRIEHGWSAQAPYGVLGVTAARLREETSR